MGLRKLLDRLTGWIARSLRVERPRLSAFEPARLPPSNGDFCDLFDRHAGRRCMKWHHYLGIYDRELGPLRNLRVTDVGQDQPLRLLEIGVWQGGSLELWREYLGPHAIIHGVDINPACADLSTVDLPVHVGSQADSDFLQRVVEEMGGVDIVLDDGSHLARHQRASFDVLFPLLSESGLYIIEDTHTSYWWKHQGGFRRPGTAIQMAKSLVDGMHHWYFRAPLDRRSRMAKTQIESITFYDSIIIIRKGIRERPIARTTPILASA